MAFLRDKCIRVPLTDEIIKSAVPFSCGNADLDDFFSSDYADYAHQLMGKTYVYVQDGGGNDIVSAHKSVGSSRGANFRARGDARPTPCERKPARHAASSSISSRWQAGAASGASMK